MMGSEVAEFDHSLTPGQILQTFRQKNFKNSIKEKSRIN